MFLEARKVQELYSLAEKYAKLKNFDVKSYLDGLFHDMLHDDNLKLNTYAMTNKLISYHLQWIKEAEIKNGHLKFQSSRLTG